MTELLTAEQMRAAEHAAIESGAVTGVELMERAGRGVVAALLARWPELATAPHRAVVLCGPGNNGGDGFVVARLLAERGWEVAVRLYGEAAKLPPDAARNAELWQALGDIGPLASDSGQADDASPPDPPDLGVDALFGTGLTRPLPDRLADVLARWAAALPAGRCRRVAIDAPSGLCLDSGRVLSPPGRPREPAWRMDLTVTFHAPKLGHYLAEGPRWCGSLEVVDIGLPRGEGQGLALARPNRRGLAKGLPEHASAHKYDHGHALVLAGGVGTGGAARLAARGALRVGAGAVTVGAPPAAIIENAAQLDAIMLRPVKALEEFLARPAAGKMNALCLGPGFGQGAGTREAVAAACRSGRAVVLDADALTSFEEAPEALFRLLHERCVLTPHPGEFRRIFPDLGERLAATPERGPAYSRVGAAREAARRAGAVVLLKGPDTVIAGPTGQTLLSDGVYARAAPWLATAGAGDVLAGLITGLLARGLPPMDAAATAAWLHVECARRFGPGLIAEDLPEQLPAVFRDLGP